MSIAAIVRALVAAKATPDMILAAVEAAEAERDDALERRRQNDRDRKARQRETEAVSRDVTGVSRDVTGRHNDRQPSSPRAPDPAHVEDNLQTKISTGQQEKKKTPRDELAAVLDAEHADAVLEHRQKLRKPLSARAAKLMAAELAKAPDPNAAADRMIEKGWQSFEVEWLDKPAPRATPPPATERMYQVLDDIKSGKLDVPDLLNGKSHEPAHPGPTIDASFERADRRSSGHPIQVHALPSGHRS